MKSDEVNSAISQHLGLWWKAETAEAVEAEYGPEVLSLAREVYDYAVNYPVDWSRETYEGALGAVRAAVARQYPFLSEVSLRQVVDCFAYSYR